MRAPADGFVLLDKPSGITSFVALESLKDSLQTRRIGHTGTLDKFASGLLVALTGRYTRLAELFTELDKEYRATITFGVSTDTLDPEGDTVEEGPLPEMEALQEAAARFTGPLLQYPPEYSALHIGGKRAHEIVRAGGNPELRARRVTVHRFELLAFQPPELTVKVRCSKGTYIRALARDLAREVGSCAYVSSLRRTRVGPFHVAEAVLSEDFDPARDLLAALQIFGRLPGVETLRIKAGYGDRIRNGAPLEEGYFETPCSRDGPFALFDGRDELVAVASRSGGRFRYTAVF